MIKIDQNNFRDLLPGKISRAITIISKNNDISLAQAQNMFYESSTYKLLEIEKTKYWWMSAEQLADEYLSNSSKINL